MANGTTAPARTLRLCVAALGGQGGAVLTDWLIRIAEAHDWLVQATSVPGVAQRTGATIYYLEFFPRSRARQVGIEPIMALMPVPGDVDAVIASELAEAGRAIQRGLVTSDRTMLIASTHRSYSIAEKSALGNGAVDPVALETLVRSQAKRAILFDMEELAVRHEVIVSAVLLGAICGSGVLPFSREAYLAAIEASGIAIESNTRAFEEASRIAASPQGPQKGGKVLEQPESMPEKAQSRSLQGLLDRIRGLPTPIAPLALHAARRLIDYQDARYAMLYLDRLERVVALEPASGEYSLSEATARGLALWMSFEDTIRVADFKTRAPRLGRIRTEVRATTDEVLGVTDFLKPRLQEIAGTLPAGIGRWLLNSRALSSIVNHWTQGRRIRTSGIRGFLLLYAVAGLRGLRRRTLRYKEENSRIEEWLSAIVRMAPRNHALARELALCQRLIKGYGETHERGWRNYCLLKSELPRLIARADGPEVLAQLRAAALANEEGTALSAELERLANSTSSSPQPHAA
jgi:indolepyruvate ferredoxin oxidoreductase, beta subunit